MSPIRGLIGWSIVTIGVGLLSWNWTTSHQERTKEQIRTHQRVDILGNPIHSSSSSPPYAYSSGGNEIGPRDTSTLAQQIAILKKIAEEGSSSSATLNSTTTSSSSSSSSSSPLKKE